MVTTIPESYERCSGGAPSMSSGDGTDYTPKCHCSCGLSFSALEAEPLRHHRLGHVIRYRGVVQSFTERAK